MHLSITPEKPDGKAAVPGAMATKIKLSADGQMIQDKYGCKFLSSIHQLIWMVEPPAAVSNLSIGMMYAISVSLSMCRGAQGQDQ